MARIFSTLNIFNNVVMNTAHKKRFCLYCPSAFLPPSSLTNDDGTRKCGSDVCNLHELFIHQKGRLLCFFKTRKEVFFTQLKK